jgi:hypothetical protein
MLQILFLELRIYQFVSIKVVEHIRCGCGEPCKLITVNKEGPNKGRQFYSCAKNRDDTTKCDYFNWSDEDILPPKPKPVIPEGAQVPNCRCNMPATIRITHKEGPNKGKQFWCCPNVRIQFSFSTRFLHLCSCYLKHDLE